MSESHPPTCRHLGIKQFLVGGKNPDWETPKISEIPVGWLTLSKLMRCQLSLSLAPHLQDLMGSLERTGARPKPAGALQRAAKGGVGKASGADDDEFGWGNDEGYS